VLTDCKPPHRQQEFLSFLRRIEQSVPQQLDIHLIVDNYSAHKHPRVKAWLARRPRWHIHFIPTYSSWLKEIVKELVAKIDHFVTHYNKHCRPFVWTATADSVLEKLERLTSRISGTGHLGRGSIRTEQQHFRGLTNRAASDREARQMRVAGAPLY
jgi:putative transposase